MKRHLAFVLLFIFLLSCSRVDELGTHIGIGESLPEFSTFTLDGRNVSTADLVGKPSVVILFDTTCPDCHRQLPQVQAAYDALGDKVNVLAVSRKDVPDAVSEFWAANGFTIPVATSKGPDIYQAFDRGSKSGVPQLYLCNPGGIVLFYSGDERVTTTTEIVREISDFI